MDDAKSEPPSLDEVRALIDRLDRAERAMLRPGILAHYEADGRRHRRMHGDRRTERCRMNPTFSDYWNANVAQFDDCGPSGVSHIRGACDGITVDALLFRDEAGKVRGILYYHADQVYEEVAGNVTIVVDEHFRRRGIATTLLREAEQRWSVRFNVQDYLVDGRAFVAAYRARHHPTR